MVRERDEHGLVDARALHLGEELLCRGLAVGRVQVVHVARVAVGDRREHVEVRVDDGHAPSQ